jgi:GNAT superfamily N-acetyltransferase
MYLEDLFVDLPYRKLGTWPISSHRLADRFFFLEGLGKALLRATAADAVRRGCARLNLQVLDWNTPSIQFYDSTGGKALKEWLTYRWEGASLKQLAGQ